MIDLYKAAVAGDETYRLILEVAIPSRVKTLSCFRPQEAIEVRSGPAIPLHARRHGQHAPASATNTSSHFEPALLGDAVVDRAPIGSDFPVIGDCQNVVAAPVIVFDEIIGIDPAVAVCGVDMMVGFELPEASKLSHDILMSLYSAR